MTEQIHGFISSFNKSKIISFVPVYGCCVLQLQTSISGWTDDAYLLEIAQGCSCQSRLKWAVSLTHLYIWFANSFPVVSDGLGQSVSEAASVILLLLAVPPRLSLSLTQTCHHFPADAVLLIGGCCCVTWRSLRPFTDRAAPAPWLPASQSEGGGGTREEGRRREPSADCNHTSPLLFFCPSSSEQ